MNKKNFFEPKVNLYKKLASNAGVVRLPFVCDRIRSGYYANEIKLLRDTIAQGDEKTAGKLKKQLDAFTVSAVYKGARRRECMTEYTAMVVLDFDKLDPAKLPALKAKAAAMPATVVAFISPSGRGLKILCIPKREDGVIWPLTLANHGKTYNAMRTLYERELNEKADASGSDPSRICFMSHDPEIFFDPDRLVGWAPVNTAVEERVRGTGYGVRGRRKGYRRIGV